jgi:hypothetical protein
VSNRQRIKRQTRNGASRGAIVSPDGHRPLPVVAATHHCVGCGRELAPVIDPNDARPRPNPEAEAIQAHIADLQGRLIALAVADLKAMTLEQARAIFGHPDNDAEGGAGDAASYYVYRHYAEGMDDFPPFVEQLSDALDAAILTADVGEESRLVWDLPVEPDTAPQE